jgi:Protein of unknown function (DUF4232)
MIVRLTNHGAATCRLYGYPMITLLDRAGHSLPFRVHRGGAGDQMITTRPSSMVVVAPRRHAFVGINKYRCDGGDRRLSRFMRLQVPGARKNLSLIARIPAWLDLGYCGRGDPGSSVAVSPFEPTANATLRQH